MAYDYANKDEFEKEIETGSYGTKSLEKCGFIHCSDLDTYYMVAPNFKNDYTEKLILLIDTERLNFGCSCYIDDNLHHLLHGLNGNELVNSVEVLASG